MSKYSYAGKFVNPADHWFVKEVDDHFEIWVLKDDGTDRPHSSAGHFEDYEDAAEYIESVRERFEEDYDQYLEENGAEIARMEAYEDWRNEY